MIEVPVALNFCSYTWLSRPMAKTASCDGVPLTATAMVPLVPVMLLVTVSVAVMVWLPAVLSVTPLGKAWTPLSPAVKG